MLDFFKKIKKKNEKKNIKNLKIHDIKIIPHKEIILFKNKDWKIEITKQKIFEFLYKFKFLISGLLVFLIIIFSFFYFKSKAETVQFYPESCLGGWQNPQNASGVPDLDQNSKLEDFNESNSAFLKNIISEIYCGNFKGDIPENSKPQKAILKFSWAILEGEKNNQINLGGGENNKIETSTLIQVDYLSTSSDETINTTSNTNIEETITQTTTLKNENQNISSDSILNQESISNENQNLDNESQIPIQNQNDNVLKEDTPEQTPINTLEQTPEQSQSSYFWNKLFNFVFAQNLENDLENKNSSLNNLENVNTTTQSDIEELKQSDSIIINQTNTINTFSTENTSTESNLIENTSTEKNDKIENKEDNIEKKEDNIFEILYTFDGANWNSLEKIGFSNWQNLELEIPNFDWSKLENFQVKIQSLSPKEYNFTAYLDGIILEVEYDFWDNFEEISYKISELNSLDLDNILKIKGINDSLVISIFKIEDNYYTVLIDLDKNKFYKIYLADFDSPVGIKNNLVFWKKGKRIFYFDPLNFKLYAKKFNDFDKSRGERAGIEFSNLDFKLIFDGNNFYFKDSSLGEIFSEENGYGLENFRKKFEIDKILYKEKISDLGFIIDENEEN